MSINEALSNARSAALAQSQEDFEYFANTVCGLHISHEVCAAVQENVLAGRGIAHLTFAHTLHGQAAYAWMGIVGKGPSVSFPSETFAWIFSERAA